MADPQPIFDRESSFDPSADFEAFLAAVPAKWAVYLLADEHDQPVQLLCVRNLRASLRRRLGGQEPAGPSRKVNYREVVRRIRWRRVDSAFEADWVYLESARRLFPQTYQGMVGFRPAWFIHVNPATQFPRYTKTIQLDQKTGLLIGPIEDKHAAQRLIELLEDIFDLCRYYNILIQAPHGKACPYKEMGKCPAPCDGSIPMDQYRRMIELSAQTLIDPADFLRDATQKMQRASQDLQFESAARIKAKIDEAGQLGKGPFRHARRLEDFSFLSLQRGPSSGTARLFLITPGQIEEIAGLIAPPESSSDLPRHILSSAAARTAASTTTEGAERIGLAAWHLFSPKQVQGVFIRLSDLDHRSLAKAFADLRKSKAPEESEGEGVMKELNAL